MKIKVIRTAAMAGPDATRKFPEYQATLIVESEEEDNKGADIMPFRPFVNKTGEVFKSFGEMSSTGSNTTTLTGKTAEEVEKVIDPIKTKVNDLYANWKQFVAWGGVSTIKLGVAAK